jgi:hypothetical protein
MNTALKNYLRSNGRKGGQKTAERGPEFYSRIGKLGMKKRWAKKRALAKKATV